MNKWLAQLDAVQRLGQRAVSVAVASTRGSVPREAGTRMLVTSTAIFGTIGGGHLEFKAIEIARAMLTENGAVSLHRFPLGASLGQCCGGLVNLLFEPIEPEMSWIGQLLSLQRQGEACVVVTPVHGKTGKLIVTDNAQLGSLDSDLLNSLASDVARQRLKGNQPSTMIAVDGHDCFFESIRANNIRIMLFGAGHVGRALVRILADLPCQVTWIDSREEEFPVGDCGEVQKLVHDEPAEMVSSAQPGTWFLVMTHSHQLDQAISERILRRGDFSYFGLIGSISKRRQFERRLVSRGIAPTRVAMMTCPIGAGGINSKEPMAIAVSIAAELLQRHQKIQQADLELPNVKAR